MSIYESIMQGLTEVAGYQQGKIRARKTKLTIKPIDAFSIYWKKEKEKC
ncbi:MAG: hypothetical protein LBI28_11790 [Treponema sp.]|nr:hypothetical protein [Treponema sp.]